MRQINEPKRSDGTLSAAEEKFSKIFQFNPHPMIISSLREETCLDVNESLLRLTGLKRDEVLGQNTSSLNIWEKQGAREEFIDLLRMQGGVRDFETRLVTKAGEVLSLLLSAEEIELGGERCLLISINDITERRRTEAALSRMNAELEQRTAHLKQVNQILLDSERRLRLAIETGRIGLFVWDSTQVTNPGDWSHQCKEIFGLPLDAEVTHDMFLKCVHPGDREHVDQCVRQALMGKNGGEYDIEYRTIKPQDGSHHWVTARGQAFFDTEGHAVRFIGTVMDITERKRAEEALSRQNAELEERIAARTADLARTNQALQNEIDERKRAEESLSKLAAIVESADDAIISKTLDGIITNWNRGAERIYGYTPEEAIGRPISIIFPPDHADELTEILERVMRGERVEHFETERVRKDGQRLDVSLTVSPIKNAEGEIIGSSAIARDITERKLAEEKLRRSEAYLTESQRLSHTGSVAFDVVREENIYWSPETYRIFGFEPQEGFPPGSWTTGAHPRRVHPDDALELEEKAQQAVQGKNDWVWDYRAVRPDGSIRYIHSVGHPVLNAEGLVVEFVGTVMDVTERKLAEEQLLLTKYSIDHVADSAFWVSSDARIVFVNDASCKSLGYTREELLQLTVHDIDPEFPEEVWAAHWNDLRERQSLTLESKQRRKDGHIFPVELSLNYLLYDGQEYNFAFARDITERKQRDEAMQLLTTRLLQLQDEERRRIARDLHDVTAQDLGAVAVNLAHLRRLVTDLKPEAQNLVTESASLAEGVFQQIRTLSYLLHPPLLDQAGLASALRWYIDGFTKRSGIQVDIEIAPEIGRLSPEIETALFRIVQESLTNIHRHSGSGSATIRLVKQERKLSLHVQDQGAGMMDVTDGEVADNVQLLGLGILGMRQRLRQFGGKLEINTSKLGTHIIASVPLPGE